MDSQLQIVGIGEVLMDVFADGTATMGGAPFNVAFHAHQLLKAGGRGSGVVASAVGQDEWGRHIVAAVRDAGMSDRYLVLNAHFPTGIANVFLDGSEAGYEIPAGQAWDHLPWDAALEELSQHTSAVAFGSLAQRSEGSAATIQRFVSQVRGPRLFDVNLRQNSTDRVKGYSAAILDAGCRLATIVKCNEAELEEIGTLLALPDLGAGPDETADEERLEQRMEQLRARYTLTVVVVTRGAKGAMLRSADVTLRLPDSTLAPGSIHPVGAGDAFSAGLLVSIAQGSDLATGARIADRLASWVTGYASATPELTPGILADLQALEQAGSDTGRPR